MERSLADVSSLLEVDKPRRVDVATFSGPLVLLILGLSVSVVIAAAEITYYRQRGRVSTVEITKQKPGASLGRRSLARNVGSGRPSYYSNYSNSYYLRLWSNVYHNFRRT